MTTRSRITSSRAALFLLASLLLSSSFAAEMQVGTAKIDITPDFLTEGGYEAETSLWYYDRPARLPPETEDLIIKTVHAQMPPRFKIDPKQSQFPLPQSPSESPGSLQLKLTYTVMENNAEDSNRVLQVEAAPDLVDPGKPVNFEVTGSPTKSQRWFGLYLVKAESL